MATPGCCDGESSAGLRGRGADLGNTSVSGGDKGRDQVAHAQYDCRGTGKGAERRPVAVPWMASPRQRHEFVLRGPRWHPSAAPKTTWGITRMHCAPQAWRARRPPLRALPRLSAVPCHTGGRDARRRWSRLIAPIGTRTYIRIDRDLHHPHLRLLLAGFCLPAPSTHPALCKPCVMLHALHASALPAQQPGPRACCSRLQVCLGAGRGGPASGEARSRT